MGVGIWIIVDRNFMSAILGTDLMTAAAYLIVVGGAIITVISLMGCLGAMMESKALLLIVSGPECRKRNFGRWEVGGGWQK